MSSLRSILFLTFVTIFVFSEGNLVRTKKNANRGLRNHFNHHANRISVSHDDRKHNFTGKLESKRGLKISEKGLKEFPDSGPFTYDYLLGANKFSDGGWEVVFLDYDIPKKAIQSYLDAGTTVICYVNVGAWEDWRDDANEFPLSVLGNNYDGWPGERWLDIRKHNILLPLMKTRYENARDKGCQGIDPDNMNGYTVKTGFPLKYDDQILYNEALSELAHSLGMMAGLKNDNEQALDLEYLCDFAVLESCAVYDECSYLDSFISAGKPVFAVEYTDEWSKDDFSKTVCAMGKKNGMSYILKKLNLHDDFIVTCS